MITIDLSSQCLKVFAFSMLKAMFWVHVFKHEKFSPIFNILYHRNISTHLKID